MDTPRVNDNDRDEITVKIGERLLRSYTYDDEAERRTKIGKAREYVEGWYAASEAESSASRACLMHMEEALTERLEAYSYYFPPGNPWADKARAALSRARGE